MSYNRSNGGAAALAFARELTGRPYIYGGEWPEDGGTDCSGLVQWAYGQVRVMLPRTTEEQYLSEQINNKATPSEPGDLLFIEGSPVDANPGHVMIYVSPGEVFEAFETGTLIGQFPFDTDLWEFRTRPALLLPAPPAPPPLPPARGHPTAGQIKSAGLVVMTDIAEAELAEANGWALWYWASTHFVAQVGSKPNGVTLYANKDWRKRKP